MISRIMIVLAVLLLNSCESDLKTGFITFDGYVAESDLTIDAGYICGWGAGGDTLKIWNSTVKYVYYTRTQSPITKTRKLTKEEWSEIIGLADMKKFNSLNYHSNDISFDGCDEWITIARDNSSHSIRYSKGLEIDEIRNLQNKLNSLRRELGNCKTALVGQNP